MSIYFKHLNLNVPILKDTAPLKDLRVQYHIDMNKSVREFVHLEFIKILSIKNTYIQHMESFYSCPDIKLDIHIDSRGGDYIKINYVIGGENSVMNWYTPKSTVDNKIQLTGVNTEYMTFDRNQVELVQSANINPVSIVQVGVPHNITNPTSDRLCISMCIAHRHNQQRLTMAEAMEIFSEYIVD